MARGQYIYLIEQHGEIVATFSVKHELVSFLKKRQFYVDKIAFHGNGDAVQVYRMPDNPLIPLPEKFWYDANDLGLERTGDGNQ